MADNSALLLWKRLIPTPISNDANDAMRCEVHDPLWLLGRQWQMGEFKAEDAGMAAFAHVIAQSTAMQILRGNNPAQPPVPYNPLQQPLNAIIEAIPPNFDLALRIEAGRKWQKILQAAGKQDAWNSYRQNPILQFEMVNYTYDTASVENGAYTGEAYQQMLATVSSGRHVDGASLFKEFQTRKASDFLSATDNTINDLGLQWITWIAARLGNAIGKSVQAWSAASLEYKSSAASPLAAGAAWCTQLPEHNGDSMDSHSWEQALGDAAMTVGLDAAQLRVLRKTLMPIPVSYPSMPRTRWWEFEDATLDLSNIQTGKTDLGLLLLAEFGLKFSNDWLQFPLPVTLGDFITVRNIRVTDVFGVQTIIKPVAHDASWNLFQVAGPSTKAPVRGLFLPPVLQHFLESERLEEVHFLRDEMANMAWAVEQIVPDCIGSGIDGKAEGDRFEQWLKLLMPAPIETTAATTITPPADFRYLIGTSVQPNWIPMVPWRPAQDAQIVFRRGSMPRLPDGQQPTRIRPRTDILSVVTDAKKHYDIEEAEIPATGIIVGQAWRRGRWVDGSVVTWLAREKTIGRETTASGLQFDLL